MKTVQQVLRELDTEKLIAHYLWEYPIEYDRYEEWLDLTIREIRDTYRKDLADLIQRLREMKISEPEDGHQGVLFVHKVLEEYLTEEYRLVHLDELIELGPECENYAYGFTKQSEIVGFLVADTPLTQRYIYDLMTNVLDQASFFGYKQEYLQEEIEKLNAPLESPRRKLSAIILNEEPEEQWHEMRGVDSDYELPEERKLRYSAAKAETAFDECSRRNQIALIRDAYLKTNGGKDHV